MQPKNSVGIKHEYNVGIDSISKAQVEKIALELRINLIPKTWIQKIVLGFSIISCIRQYKRKISKRKT